MKKEMFVCDECKSEQEKITGFPYEKDWCYLHKVALKIATPFSKMHNEGSEVELKDKHFCKKKCLLKHIETLLEE